jgi:CO/xanthine dehydrogenase Mo-binding subunit
VITGEGDIGQGARTVYAMIAAEELGARYEDVDVTMGDTDFGPYCLGYYASRGVVTAGNAVKLAAADAKRQVLEHAARLLETKPDRLEARGGEIFDRAWRSIKVDFRQVSEAAIYHQGGGPIIGKGIYDAPSEPLDRKTKYGHIAPTYSFGAQVAEVEVDRETGIIKVLNIWAAEDAGRVLHPASAEGQIEGAVGMGFGFTIMEELKWDQGKILNPTLLDYKMPTTEDVPPIHHDFVITEDPFGPFGAKAMSESPGVPTPAAIANAIYDAVGLRITELPVEPSRVLQALKLKDDGSRT